LGVYEGQKRGCPGGKPYRLSGSDRSKREDGPKGHEIQQKKKGRTIEDQVTTPLQKMTEEKHYPAGQGDKWGKKEKSEKPGSAGGRK